MIAHYEDEKIRIHKVVCGPYDNNAYLIVSIDTNESLIIDTPDNPGELISLANDTNVKTILITHNHSDHTQGLTEVKSATQSPVAIGKADSWKLSKTIDHILRDGEEIIVGTVSLKTLATPGHTPGSTSFVIDKHLFSGDTLFPGGPGRSESPQNLAQIIDSITQKLFTLGDNVTFYPGHGVDGDIKTAKQEYAIFESSRHAKNMFGDIHWLKN